MSQPEDASKQEHSQILMSDTCHLNILYASFVRHLLLAFADSAAASRRAFRARLVEQEKALNAASGHQRYTEPSIGQRQGRRAKASPATEAGDEGSRGSQSSLWSS